MILSLLSMTACLWCKYSCKCHMHSLFIRKHVKNYASVDFSCFNFIMIAWWDANHIMFMQSLCRNFQFYVQKVDFQYCNHLVLLNNWPKMYVKRKKKDKMCLSFMVHLFSYWLNGLTASLFVRNCWNREIMRHFWYLIIYSLG